MRVVSVSKVPSLLSWVIGGKEGCLPLSISTVSQPSRLSSVVTGRMPGMPFLQIFSCPWPSRDLACPALENIHGETGVVNTKYTTMYVLNKTIFLLSDTSDLMPK